MALSPSARARLALEPPRAELPIRPTWMQMADAGTPVAIAARIMGCDVATARARLLGARRMVESRNRAAGAGAVARCESRFRDASRFPEACLELAGRISNSDGRDLYLGPVTDRQRNMLASKMPTGELTPVDGVSVGTREQQAAERYRKRLAASKDV